MKQTSKTLSRVQKWVDGILSGDVPSCHMIYKAAERWQSDWTRDDIYFDEKDVIRAHTVASKLKHYKGEKAGHAIRLEDWQLFILANIFGWKRRDTGTRRFTYADVFVPRKNGKTTFAAIVAIILMIFDNESGAEVYAAAVDKEQARICFDAAKALLRNSEFSELVDIFTGSIVDTETASVFKPLSKETKNKDGLNPHAGICDERHAWKTNEIFEVLKTGMGARRQPMLFSISTAGTDTSYPYYGDLQVLRDVMDGVKEKDNHFIMLFEPDEGDRYDDPATWYKVNPNLGVSLSERYMEEECAEAKLKGGSTLAAFCTKNLNMWVDAPEVWIADDLVCVNNSAFDESQLEGAECFVGIDLARKTDISATAFYFPQFKVVKYLFVVPEAKIAEVEDRVDYRKWAEQGWIVAAPGAVLEDDWFVAELCNRLAHYDIKCIAYDPWGMWNIANKFTAYADVMMEYQQNIRYMSVPTKWFESAVIRGEMNFLGNPVIRWMMRNVVIYQDANANIKLDKARSRNKIDGVVATVDAIGGWLNKASEEGEKKIYTTHTLRTISL